MSDDTRPTAAERDKNCLPIEKCLPVKTILPVESLFPVKECQACYFP
jgi:hypothetical protein